MKQTSFDSATIIAALMFVGLACISTDSEAQNDTTFTYQGVLNENGTAITDTCDFQFRLFDAVSGGNQVSVNINHFDVDVIEGRFNVAVDFGPTAYNGSDRWLEILVRCPAGTGQYTILNPRQKLTSSPHSIQTRGLYVSDDESFIGIGRTDPITPSEIFGLSTDTNGFGGMYIETSGSDGDPFYGYSAGGDIDAYHAVDGATGDWYLVNNGSVRMTVELNGQVGIGTSNPGTKLDVDGTVRAGSFWVDHIGGGFSQLFDLFDDLWLTNGAAGDMILATGARPGDTFDRLRIKADGDVLVGGSLGIGGTPTQAKLYSNGGNQHGAYLLSGQTGVWGATNSQLVGRYGVFGQHPAGNSYAVWASGNMGASGTKAFRIDHPLDPQNKYLIHYCSEAPEPLNIYSGTIVLNEHGRAWVELPEYFEHINRDFRYQLTCIGGYANVYIAQEVQNNQFQIAGGSPGLKVSWEVKGVRDDLWVRSNGAPVEMEKPNEFKGKLLHPELFGLSEEYSEHPTVVSEPEPIESIDIADVSNESATNTNRIGN